MHGICNIKICTIMLQPIYRVLQDVTQEMRQYLSVREMNIIPFALIQIMLMGVC